jgi:hypothetical protein
MELRQRHRGVVAEVVRRRVRNVVGDVVRIEDLVVLVDDPAVDEAALAQHDGHVLDDAAVVRRARGGFADAIDAALRHFGGDGDGRR